MEGMSEEVYRGDARIGDLFGSMLSIEPYWRIAEIKKTDYPLPGPDDPDPLLRFEGRLDVYLEGAGDKLPCSVCYKLSPRRDMRPERMWTDYPAAGWQIFIHAAVPRVKCDEHGVVSAAVPWARTRSTFTWRLEFRALALCRMLSVTEVAEILGVIDHRLLRMLGHYASRIRDQISMVGVTRVGVDETASRRGQRYITVFVDLDTHAVLYVAEGRSHETVLAFRDEMIRCGGDPNAVMEFSQDMSEAFAKGVRAGFPNARISYDKFHVIKAMNEAVDQVRREEQQTCDALRKTRFLWLHNRSRLRAGQARQLDSLLHQHLKTGRAYELRMQLQEFFDQPEEVQEPYLEKWFWRATHSRLRPVAEVAWMVRNHWEGILNAAATGTTNAVLEGVNSLIQRARSRARGFRNVQNLINMAYFLSAHIDRRTCTLSVE